MKHVRHLDLIVFLGLLLPVLSALPACNTQEIGPNQTLRDNHLVPNAIQGIALIDLARPEDTYADVLADGGATVSCSFQVDKKTVVNSDGEMFTAPLGTSFTVGNFEGGLHHFAVIQVGGATLFEGDGQITAGAVTHLYVFGTLGALQGRFVTHPVTPAADTVHISAINLVRAGAVDIEVVSCAGRGMCTPVSPPVALGEIFERDFPGAPLPYGALSLSTDGVGFGYREVASAALPEPPIQTLIAEWQPGLQTAQANLVAAPEYLLADGTCPLAGD